MDSPVLPEGEMPDWYPTLVTAKELNRPPWQFDGIDPDTTDVAVLEFWKQKVLIARAAESMAQKEMTENSDMHKTKGKPLNAQQKMSYEQQIQEQLRLEREQENGG